MFGSDVFQAGRPHSSSTKYNLTCPRVESLQEFNNATHRLSDQHREVEVDDHEQVIREEDKDFQRC